MPNRWYGKEFNQDKAAHQTYAFAMDAKNIPHGAVDEVCVHCGGRLQVYYCEERLCLVRCLNCGIAALTEASNHGEAARKTIGAIKNKNE